MKLLEFPQLLTKVKFSNITTVTKCKIKFNMYLETFGMYHIEMEKKPDEIYTINEMNTIYDHIHNDLG